MNLYNTVDQANSEEQEGQLCFPFCKAKAVRSAQPKLFRYLKRGYFIKEGCAVTICLSFSRLSGDDEWLWAP